MRTHWILGAAAVAAISGCGLTDPDVWAERGEDLERHRALWDARAPETYEFVVARYCECIAGWYGPVRIQVSDGVFQSVRVAATGEAVPSEHWPAFDTIPDLFALLQRAIQRRAHRFLVEYDETWGHPRDLYVDFSAEIVDDEISIQVEEFRPAVP